MSFYKTLNARLILRPGNSACTGQSSTGYLTPIMFLVFHISLKSLKYTIYVYIFFSFSGLAD
jgi:hypothetical protein